MDEPTLTSTDQLEVYEDYRDFLMVVGDIQISEDPSTFNANASAQSNQARLVVDSFTEDTPWVESVPKSEMAELVILGLQKIRSDRRTSPEMVSVQAAVFEAVDRLAICFTGETCVRAYAEFVAEHPESLPRLINSLLGAEAGEIDTKLVEMALFDKILVRRIQECRGLVDQLEYNRLYMSNENVDLISSENKEIARLSAMQQSLRRRVFQYPKG